MFAAVRDHCGCNARCIPADGLGERLGRSNDPLRVEGTGVLSPMAGLVLAVRIQPFAFVAWRDVWVWRRAGLGATDSG
jgi:hypothetical protein